MWQKDDYTISTDKSLLEFDIIHKYISCDSYWGIGRSQEVMQRAIEHSAFCFGVYHGKKQIGFARVVSDLATFGYIADVFILIGYRGHGLGKWLIQTIVTHPELAVLKRLMLFTRTPDFYGDAGFKIFDQSHETKFLERKV
ncbi:GNAT family N-acetyltransferase [Sporomusa sp.]|uniref:GNAT family N-acetyltransferase n=1 Tax=Sporomusa sp. TaxID=2078658 RepID=UPI002CAC1F66|nr:GNAT family N-acetyltransferase [Sporomusa sp.]HWR43260.1 GNAT family N-acetyltransferase [Sporomusa sp.]